MIDFALDDRYFINSYIDEYILEIDLLFNTSHTELIGDVHYGTSFEDFLWRMEPSEQDLYNYVVDKLRTTFMYNKFNTDVKVEIMDGTQRSIYCLLIQITTDSGEKKEKTYIYK